MDLVVMASAFHLSRACPLSYVCVCVSCFVLWTASPMCVCQHCPLGTCRYDFRRHAHVACGRTSTSLGGAAAESAQPPNPVTSSGRSLFPV